MNRFFEELLKFILIFCLANFFFWTGQLIFQIVTFGRYKPAESLTALPALSAGLKMALLSYFSMAVGFSFWLISFPYIYDFYVYLKTGI